jgi:hypothetical protein
MVARDALIVGATAKAELGIWNLAFGIRNSLHMVTVCGIAA